MTCVVGIEHDGAVILGADSAYTDDNDELGMLAQPKVARVGGVVMGFAGDLRWWLIVRQALRRKHVASIERFVEIVKPALRREATESREQLDFQLLVACERKAWVVAKDFTPIRDQRGYTAIGNGASYALGALAVTETMAPIDRARAALAASARHCSAVAPPFVVTTAR